MNSSSFAFDEPDSTVDEDTLIYRHTDVVLSQFFAPSPPHVRLEFGAVSHPGKVRSNNEDHYVIVRRRRFRDVLMTNLPAEAIPDAEDQAYAMIVADGMGGPAFGELASALVLSTGMDLGLHEIKSTMKVTDAERKDLKEKLVLFVKLIDRKLFEHAASNAELTGMGSTLTGVYTVGAEAVVVHVGDSRAYLHRDHQLVQMTRDHTAAQELIDAGFLTAESERAKQLSFMLTNCLGGIEQGAEPDIHHVTLVQGDRILLCTDGLTDLVTDDEISRLLEEHAEPNSACQSLIDLALERGGRDNVTALIGRYEFPAV